MKYDPQGSLLFVDVTAGGAPVRAVTDSAGNGYVVGNGWIDLGPEGGHTGGRVVATGTPEGIAACAASHTGRILKAHLRAGR